MISISLTATLRYDANRYTKISRHILIQVTQIRKRATQ